MISAPMRPPQMVQILRQACQEIIRPDFIMAELGCYYGESTVEFACHASIVFAVDPWLDNYIGSGDLQTVGRTHPETMEEVEKIFDTMTQPFPQIHKVKKRQEDAVADFEDMSLDLVYCDTIHSEEDTSSAITLWTPKVKPGGYISGHDYLDVFPGVKAAVDMNKNSSFRLWEDGNWAYRRGFE